jgi:hypothetical protein
MFSKMLGDVFGVGPDSAENKALADTKRVAEDEKNYFSDLFGKTNEALNTSYAEGEAALKASAEEGQTQLNDFYKSQQGQASALTKQILDSARAKSAESGLIGGTQEATLAAPLLENLGTSLAAQGANALQNFTSTKSNNLLGFLSQKTGNISNLLQTILGGRSGSGQANASAKGLYGRPVVDEVAGAVGSVGSIIKGIGGMF